MTYEFGRLIENISFIFPLLIILLLIEWLFDLRARYSKGIRKKAGHMFHRLYSSMRNSEKVK